LSSAKGGTAASCGEVLCTYVNALPFLKINAKVPASVERSGTCGVVAVARKCHFAPHLLKLLLFLQLFRDYLIGMNKTCDNGR